LSFFKRERWIGFSGLGAWNDTLERHPRIPHRCKQECFMSFFFKRTCRRSRSSAHIADDFQSMTSENGITQLLDSKTGMQPAWIFNQRGRKRKRRNNEVSCYAVWWMNRKIEEERKDGRTWRTSTKRKDPSRRPRGTRQNVELCSKTS